MKELEKEIMSRLRVPTTKAGRLASIVETIRHTDGVHVQKLLGLFSYKFGLKRKTIVGYFKDLERADMIKIDRLNRVHLTSKK